MTVAPLIDNTSWLCCLRYTSVPLDKVRTFITHLNNNAPLAVRQTLPVGYGRCAAKRIALVLFCFFDVLEALKKRGITQCSYNTIVCLQKNAIQ